MNSADLLAVHADDDSVLLLRGGVQSESTGVRRRDLYARALELSRTFLQSGVARALVSSDNPLDILRAILACQEVGADLWIAHTNLAAPNRDALLERLAIQAVVGDNVQILDVSGGPKASGAIHLMTSGSTGQPKIVTHSLESLIQRALGANRSGAIRQGKWLLTYQATAFAGLQVIFTALLTGGTLVVPESRSPVGFYEAAAAHRVSQVSGTPTFWRSFLLAAEPGVLNLSQITIGGEAVEQSTLDRLRLVFPAARLTHIYASTEAGVVFAVHDGIEGFPASWLETPPLGVQVRVRNGVLEVKSPNSMLGYQSEDIPALTEDGWLVTGDVVETREGRVRFLGRQDSLINVGGSKVYPQAIESFLLGIEGIGEARVSGVANPLTGALVQAEIVLSQGIDPVEARARILRTCHSLLPAYQVPRILKFVDQIPTEPSGKKRL